MAEGETWPEVLSTYAHPYRRWMPVAYRMSHVGRVWAVVGPLLSLGVVVDVASDGGVLAAAIWAAVMVLLWTLYVTVAAVRAIRGRTAGWRVDEQDELGRVRAHRPHGRDGDGLYAATEYAVAVGDAGDLVTWAFTPLRSDERPGEGQRLITGAPRYAAVPVDRRAYDAADTARAAEQLVDAQAQAADWEAEAARDAAKARAGLDAAAELAVESTSTGDALRRITGQRPR